MNTSLLRLSVALLSSALLAAEGSAAILTSVSSFAPDPSTVAMSINASGDVYRIKYDHTAAGGPRDAGQTFKASDLSSPVLTGITLQIGSAASAIGAGAPGAAFTIRIFEFSSATSNAPTGSPLFQDTGTLVTDIAQGAYVTFDFGTSITLDPDKFYGFQIGFNSYASNRFIDFVRSGSSVYSNGLLISATNTSAGQPVDTYSNLSADYKVAFLTIPEPSTVMLCGVALISLGLMRQRRR